MSVFCHYGFFSWNGKGYHACLIVFFTTFNNRQAALQERQLTLQSYSDNAKTTISKDKIEALHNSTIFFHLHASSFVGPGSIVQSCPGLAIDRFPGTILKRLSHLGDSGQQNILNPPGKPKLFSVALFYQHQCSQVTLYHFQFQDERPPLLSFQSAFAPFRFAKGA